MRSYTLTRRLSHADVDFLGELKVAALLGLLEQAAVEASTAAGFDASWYARAGGIWIIRRTRLQRHAPVGGGDTLIIGTAVQDFRRVRSLRAYEVRRGDDAVAAADSDWVYCDVASGRPRRVPEALQHGLPTAAAAPLPRPQPLPEAGPGSPVEHAVVVQPSDLDHVAHVNNAVYVNYLEDAAFALFAAHGWPLRRMLAAGGALRLSELDCEYLSDAVVDDRLIVRSWSSALAASAGATTPSQADLVQAIRRADDSPVLRARSRWVWRRRPPVIGAAPA